MNRKGMLDKLRILKKFEAQRAEIRNQRMKELSKDILATAKFKKGDVVLCDYPHTESTPFIINRVDITFRTDSLEYDCQYLQLKNGFLRETCIHSYFKEEKVKLTTMEEVLEVLKDGN